MNYSFKTAAGFLAAASLLSGSAFAFAPEFSSDLPTVVITDKITGLSNPYDDGTATGSTTTEYTFRFEDAFDLQSYVNFRGNDPAATKYLFNEFDFPLNSATPNTDLTLLINGEPAITDIPDATDWASAPLVTDGGDDYQLDFRNTDFSGSDENVNAGFDNIGDVTGDNIDLTDQQRWVTLYLQGDTSADFADNSFLVVTTRDGEDRLTDPFATSVLDPVFETSDFGGWTNGKVAGNALLIWGNGDQNATTPLNADSNPSGITFTPSTTPAPAATAELGINVAANEFGFGFWGANLTDSGSNPITLSANTLYRLRTGIYSTDGLSNQLRVRLGSSATTEATSFITNTEGNGATYTNGTFSIGSTSGSTLDTWILPEIDAPATVFVDALAFFGVSDSLTVDSIELSSVDAGSLGTGVQVINRGGAVATPVAGELRTVPSGETAFVTTGTSIDAVAFSNDNSTAQPTTRSFTGSQLQLTYNTPTASNGIVPSFASIGFTYPNILDNSPGLFTAAADKSYITDVWMSTSSAGGDFPQLRLRHNIANFSYYHIFDLDAAGIALGTSPRAYSAPVALPEAGQADEVYLFVDLINGDTKALAGKVIRIHRIVVTEYDVIE